PQFASASIAQPHIAISPLVGKMTCLVTALRTLVMYVQRRPEVRPRRNSSLAWLGCGCATALGLFAVIIVLAVVLLAPRLPEIAASAIGMSAQGKTEEIFQPEPPRPTVELQNASQPQQVTVNLGSYGGSQTITTDTSYYEVIVGSDPIGQQTAVVT